MTAPGPSILVVEDEPHMRRFLRASLTSNGYRVLEAGTVAEAGVVATSHNPELYLVDLGLPDGDGLDLTKSLRAWTSAPVIVLSARGRELDKVAALDAGADDYLTKPFGVGELLARLRVALRHREALAKHADEPVIEVDALHIDLARREVAVGGRPVRLTATEYRLLVLLARNAGRVLTHRQILQDVWGPGHAGETHTVRVHMAELRKKIEENPARPKLLLTEPGVGYRLRDHL
ncbi:MAG TPA: response regulator [Candidatus Bathyarchaeia archaeon]|nr:response regulator [Candidatus Bathyarchaeia archaeon]